MSKLTDLTDKTVDYAKNNSKKATIIAFIVMVFVLYILFG